MELCAVLRAEEGEAAVADQRQVGDCPGEAGVSSKREEPAAGELPTKYLILTTSPNELIEQIHNRIPVILRPEAYDAWLSGEPIDDADFEALCAPYPAGEMVARPISPLVNSPKNDGPEVLEAVEQES